MSSSRNTMKWDAKVHEDILVAINEHAKLAREDWDYVIQALHGMGYSFTESALNHPSRPSFPLVFCLQPVPLPFYPLTYIINKVTMATNAAGKTTWNDKTRSDLLQVIFDVAPPNTQQWEAISAKLRDKGYNYSLGAAQQHLQKLKKKDGDKKDGVAPATPPKKNTSKAPTPRTKKLVIPGQNKRKMIAVDEDEDEDQVDKKKLKLEAQAPNFGQYHEDEPSPPSDGEV
ncbi:hypothetical protein CHU98_g1321 [Xylaria longipes]|nr:hypothetical protein CHU98_g1321 [Xylaria longipes]